MMTEIKGQGLLPFLHVSNIVGNGTKKERKFSEYIIDNYLTN